VPFVTHHGEEWNAGIPEAAPNVGVVPPDMDLDSGDDHEVAEAAQTQEHE